uniref:C3H1-type domain-containing protein n=1 Tax=Chromera velia CCMP2878 TaxID=1169474 RepID=A0A0G4GDY4_9ALVE|eukprot:Cvel_21371.t1-p1 / transcript=Cvel_21371.t1 / gene=Cvel_21371 / organism=Chromera_velia_CCMP2878 / gene_product=hypothetical protein / transcript_product=hypothetical protein / location=Cvel_scaffold1999:340-3332(+) / protein_length=442 / sequence_SO=supercontig / SO=protein_coding / is_pseudo=false
MMPRSLRAGGIISAPSSRVDKQKPCPRGNRCCYSHDKHLHPCYAHHASFDECQRKDKCEFSHAELNDDWKRSAFVKWYRPRLDHKMATPEGQRGDYNSKWWYTFWKRDTDRRIEDHMAFIQYDAQHRQSQSQENDHLPAATFASASLGEAAEAVRQSPSAAGERQCSASSRQPEGTGGAREHEPQWCWEDRSAPLLPTPPPPNVRLSAMESASAGRLTSTSALGTFDKGALQHQSPASKGVLGESNSVRSPEGVHFDSLMKSCSQPSVSLHLQGRDGPPVECSGLSPATVAEILSKLPAEERKKLSAETLWPRAEESAQGQQETPHCFNYHVYHKCDDLQGQGCPFVHGFTEPWHPNNFVQRYKKELQEIVRSKEEDPAARKELETQWWFILLKNSDARPPNLSPKPKAASPVRAGAVSPAKRTRWDKKPGEEEAERPCKIE